MTKRNWKFDYIQVGIFYLGLEFSLKSLNLRPPLTTTSMSHVCCHADNHQTSGKKKNYFNLLQIHYTHKYLLILSIAPDILFVYYLIYLFPLDFTLIHGFWIVFPDFSLYFSNCFYIYFQTIPAIFSELNYLTVT